MKRNPDHSILRFGQRGRLARRLHAYDIGNARLAKGKLVEERESATQDLKKAQNTPMSPSSRRLPGVRTTTILTTPRTFDEVGLNWIEFYHKSDNINLRTLNVSLWSNNYWELTDVMPLSLDSLFPYIGQVNFDYADYESLPTGMNFYVTELDGTPSHSFDPAGNWTTSSDFDWFGVTNYQTQARLHIIGMGFVGTEGLMVGSAGSFYEPFAFMCISGSGALPGLDTDVLEAGARKPVVGFIVVFVLTTNGEWEDFETTTTSVVKRRGKHIKNKKRKTTNVSSNQGRYETAVEISEQKRQLYLNGRGEDKVKYDKVGIIVVVIGPPRDYTGDGETQQYDNNNMSPEIDYCSSEHVDNVNARMGSTAEQQEVELQDAAAQASASKERIGEFLDFVWVGHGHPTGLRYDSKNTTGQGDLWCNECSFTGPEQAVSQVTQRFGEPNQALLYACYSEDSVHMFEKYFKETDTVSFKGLVGWECGVKQEILYEQEIGDDGKPKKWQVVENNGYTYEDRRYQMTDVWKERAYSEQLEANPDKAVRKPGFLVPKGQYWYVRSDATWSERGRRPKP